MSYTKTVDLRGDATGGSLAGNQALPSLGALADDIDGIAGNCQ